MSQLTPCPECQRHVRNTEARCPFCDSALSLAHLPPPVLPRQRLSRAATFAFGASVVSATALAACGGDVEQRPDGQAGASSAGGSLYAGGGFNIYGAPPSGAANGGSGVAGSANGGSGVAVPMYGAPPPVAGTGPVYGAPTGGAGPEGGAGGAAGDGGVDYGGGLAIYGGPPAGTGGV